MRWFKPKQAAIDIALPKHAGFFSTDIILGTGKKSRSSQIAAALKNSFQLDSVDVIHAAADGTLAMDSVPQNIQQQKAYNNGGLVNTSLNETQLIWYAGQGFIGYQVAGMFAQNWLVDKACAMPAKDAVRNGYEITVNDGTDVDPDVIDYIVQQDKKFNIKGQCVEFLNMGRVFGTRIAIFKVDSTDPLYYEKPFNPDGVTPGSYKGITQIDPYWITPLLDAAAAGDPASMHFYEPTWWQVNGKKYHRTHLVIMRNGQLADILKPTYLYGGIPVPQKIAERVFAAERSANESPMLLMTKRLFTFKVDISQAMANMDNFQAKNELATAIRNNFGFQFIGQDEEIEQHDTALADVDDVIMTQYQLVAAASGVPVTKLLGTTPKGFNATGEYDESSYHEELSTFQEHILSPLIERHHLLLIRSHVAPKFGIEPFDTTVAWNPTDEPTSKELAEINKVKADTDAVLAQAGAVDGTDIRQRVVNDKDSGYSGMPEVVPGGPGDREAQQEQEEPLEGAVQASNKAKAQTQDHAMDEADWNAQAGTINGARVITHQRFLDEKKVAEKINNQDFVVNVTPEFWDAGKKYRMVIDGHHSLAAAMRANADPVFLESVPRDVVFNAATRQATDAKEHS